MLLLVSCKMYYSYVWLMGLKQLLSEAIHYQSCNSKNSLDIICSSSLAHFCCYRLRIWNSLWSLALVSLVSFQFLKLYWLNRFSVYSFIITECCTTLHSNTAIVSILNFITIFKYSRESQMKYELFFNMVL